MEEGANYKNNLHKDMTIDDIEKIKIKVKVALQNNENYIALHSLGEATLITENIVKEIEKSIKIPGEYTKHIVNEPTNYKTLTEEGEKVNIRDFSVIWYKGDTGRCLFGFFLNFII